LGKIYRAYILKLFAFVDIDAVRFLQQYKYMVGLNCTKVIFFADLRRVITETGVREDSEFFLSPCRLLLKNKSEQ
jgi:hypothetical protein